MKERRKHKRYNIELKIVYSTAEEPYEENKAVSIDISMGGIGMKITQAIKGKGNLKLKIYQKGRREPVPAKGKIVWQKPEAEAGPARAGVEFTEIPWTELKTVLADKLNDTLSERISQHV